MNNVEFVERVKQLTLEDTAFAFGTYGEVVDEKLIRDVYKNSLHRYRHVQDFYKLFDCIGKIAYECTAVITEPLGIVGFYGDPSPKDLYFNYSTEKYLIEDMPETIGLGVYFYEHVGVYIGNGRVIESTYAGENFGIAVTKLSEKPWTAAFKIKGVEY